MQSQNIRIRLKAFELANPELWAPFQRAPIIVSLVAKVRGETRIVKARDRAILHALD